MKCIFCKKKSDTSISREHIIPETLGNKTHILKPGIVCDKCNQYFALKIEKVLLEKKYFTEVRHRNLIQNKKRKIPKSKGIIGGEVDITRTRKGETSVIVEDIKIFNNIKNGKIKHMLIPIVDSPKQNDNEMSRLLAKIAIESLALMFYPKKGWNDEIVNNKDIDPLRNYARYGGKIKYWEYNQRRIYKETDRFINPKVSDFPYEILHEQNIVNLYKNQLYLVLILFGIEYVINLTNPKIIGYVKWLKENNNKCPIISENERKTISIE